MCRDLMGSDPSKWRPTAHGSRGCRPGVLCEGDPAARSLGGAGTDYQPTLPSTISRMRSAWPLCRAYSSIQLSLSSRFASSAG